MQESETLVRLSVVGQDDLIVDIGLDSPPDLPPTMLILDPTFAPRDELMSLARAIDQGLDATVLAIAMRQLDRYRNDDIPIGSAELPELRAYFHGWVQELVSEAADGRQRAREDS